MAKGIRVDVDGTPARVDARDVARWWADDATVDHGPASDERERAAAYVRAHPRLRTGSAGTGVAAAQRLAVLRRLAAGPVTPEDLLRAMRAAGWVGASDLENRLRELRGGDGRGARSMPLPVVQSDGLLRLTEAFPALDASTTRALAFTKALLGRLDGPLATQAVAALDAVFPGLVGAEDHRSTAAYRAGAAVLERFDEAMADRRCLRLRYFSLNSGRVGTYDMTPVRYVPLGPVLKAICVPVDADGRRAGDDRQLALDRLIDAAPLPDHPRAGRDARTLQTADLRMEVAHGLYEVLRARNTFGIAESEAEEIDVDVWRVSGTFPTALSWDVLEQLCAWAGSVQVHEPLWLVHAVVERLRAGVAVTEAGEAFRLVKPDPRLAFSSLGDALTGGAPPLIDAPPLGGPARRLPPPGQA